MSSFCRTALLVGVSLVAWPAVAGITLIVNKSAGPVTFDVDTGDGKKAVTLQPTGMTPLRVASFGALFWESPQGTVRRRLNPNTVLEFQNNSDQVILREAPPKVPPGPKLTIPVKVCVDDEQSDPPEVWKERLRKRVERASDVFEPRFGLRFKAAEFGDWKSGDRQRDLISLLREFRQKTRPGDSKLVIGFVSQAADDSGKVHLGLAAGPLGTHLLLRERRGLSENELTELLVHELGHHLGAPHSPDATSVMRPILGDGKAANLSFSISFDPISAMVISVIAGELKNRDVRRLSDLSPSAVKSLRKAYETVFTLFPDDPLAPQFLSLAYSVGPPVEDSSVEPSASVIAATRQVIGAIVEAAEENQTRPDDGAAGTQRYEKDALTALYVRSAAKSARDIPSPQGERAFLIGLAVAIDTSETLRNNPATRALWRKFETETEHSRRKRTIGVATLNGRHDLAQHFFVSAGLAKLYGPEFAEKIGLQKELFDSREGGSGFSFRDLAADLAGIQFAGRVSAYPGWGDELSRRFIINDHLPPMPELVEGLKAAEFREKFGGVGDPRFRSVLDSIRDRISVSQANRPFEAAPRSRQVSGRRAVR